MRSVPIRPGGKRGLAAAAVGLAFTAGCFTGPPAPPTEPEMALSQTALSFTSGNGSDPSAQTVTVSNAGMGTLAVPVATTTYVPPEKDWLSVTVSGNAAPYTITVQPSAAGLPQRPAPNLASISLDCPGAINTPLEVAVQLTVR